LLLSAPVFNRDARCIPSDACNQARPFWWRPSDTHVRSDSQGSSRKHEQLALRLFLSARHSSSSGTQKLPNATRHALVPQRIATALARRGVGSQVDSCLVRVMAVRKAASSRASYRPKPKEHFASLRDQRRISGPPPKEILLVDDIITRGSTLLGAANRLAEAFPGTRIRAFGAMTTISDRTDFVALTKPLIGSIQYRPSTEDTIRRP